MLQSVSLGSVNSCASPLKKGRQRRKWKEKKYTRRVTIYIEYTHYRRVAMGLDE